MNDDVENDGSNEPAQTGWVQIPVMRGIFEIAPVLDITDKFGGVVMGGYARYCCSTGVAPRPSGDVDIFPIHPEGGGSEEIFNALIGEFQSRSLKLVHENQVSITFSGSDVALFNRCPNIQIIKPISKGSIRTIRTLEEVLNHFDFSVVRVALNKDRETATAYGRKGYTIRPRQSMKLFKDWDQRPAEYRLRIKELFTRSELADMSQKDIDELEALLLVD